MSLKAASCRFLAGEVYGRSDNQEYNQFYQEIRLASDQDGAFRLASANFIDSKQEIDRLVSVDGTFGNPGLTALITEAAYYSALLSSAASWCNSVIRVSPGFLPVGVEGLTMWSGWSPVAVATRN